MNRNILDVVLGDMILTCLCFFVIAFGCLDTWGDEEF